MNILVISLLRMGDIVLSTPVIKGLKEKYPDANIDLLIHSQFRKILPLIPEVRKEFLFEHKLLQNSLCSPKSSIFEPFEWLDQFVSKIDKEKYDLILNLTHTKLSARLTALIQGKEKRGLSWNEKNQRDFGSPWFSYLNDHHDQFQPSLFHYTDILVKGSGIESKNLKFSLKETSYGEENSKKYLKESKKIIGIQALTSDQKKNWGLHNYISMIEHLCLLDQKSHILLIGAPFESEGILKIQNLLKVKGIEVDVALEDLETTYSLLKKIDVLITGDTAIKHMAVAAEVPVVELSLGSSHYWETGSYGENHTILQAKVPCAPCVHSSSCDKESHICAEKIDPQLVSTIVFHKMNLRYESIKILAEEYKEEVDVFHTKRDASGFWITELARDKAKSKAQIEILKGSWRGFLESRSHKKHSIGDIGFKISNELKRTLENESSMIEFINKEQIHFEGSLSTKTCIIDRSLNRELSFLINYIQNDIIPIFCSQSSHEIGLQGYSRKLEEILNNPMSEFVLLRKLQEILLDVQHYLAIQKNILRGMKQDRLLCMEDL